MKRGRILRLLGVLALCGSTWAIADGIDESILLPNDHPAIQYQQPPNDPVAQLAKKLESGQVKLDYNNGFSYLPALLKYFGMNIDSQMLVFSKTSFQATKIGPQAPRALYFDDNVAIGFVREGDVVELAGLDPKQGVNFYTLDMEKADKPEIVRRSECLQCHQGVATLGIPGILVSSVYPGADGMPAFRGAAMITDDRTSIEKRWGGWYVTGNTGSQHHMGNAVAHDRSQPELLEVRGTQNLTSLAGKFDISKYLAPTSDVVALMTLEHQTRMTDLMIRIGWDARMAEHDGKLDDAGKARLNEEIEQMVTYMLFADEAKLWDPVEGVSTFTKTFPERGPRDKQGRSLRDFDLQKRMFKYPLSYMIYSAAFDGMPDIVKDRVYQRLYEVLSGKDQSPQFARLSADDRKNVLEIVRETKPNLPAYWLK